MEIKILFLLVHQLQIVLYSLSSCRVSWQNVFKSWHRLLSGGDKPRDVPLSVASRNSEGMRS